METTPNMGLVISDQDTDPLDQLVIKTAFEKIDTLWGPSGPGARSKFWDSTDAGVVFPTASITTPTIPATAKHLTIVCAGFHSGAGDAALVAQINSDSTAAHYTATQFLQGAGASANANTISTLAGLFLGRLAPNGDPAPGFAFATLLDYARANAKVALGLAAAPTRNLYIFSGGYNQAAAVSTLKFFTDAATNFIAPTRITIYLDA